MLFIALVLGIVSGLRSMVSPAAVSWAARLGVLALMGTPLAFLGFAATPYILTVFALGEILNDKRASTPSRTVPVQLGGRVLSGALVGSAVCLPARHWVLGLLLGIVGALLGTYGGSAVRKRLAGVLRKDLPAALIEDAVAVLLAVVCVWGL